MKFKKGKVLKTWEQMDHALESGCVVSVLQNIGRVTKYKRKDGVNFWKRRGKRWEHDSNPWSRNLFEDWTSTDCFKIHKVPKKFRKALREFENGSELYTWEELDEALGSGYIVRVRYREGIFIDYKRDGGLNFSREGFSGWEADLKPWDRSEFEKWEYEETVFKVLNPSEAPPKPSEISEEQAHQLFEEVIASLKSPRMGLTTWSGGLPVVDAAFYLEYAGVIKVVEEITGKKIDEVLGPLK